MKMMAPFRLVMCMLVVCPLAAQQTAPPTFKSKTELVLVPVVVTSDGKPAKNLQKKDFSLLVNGKARSFDVFEEVDTVGETLSPYPPSPEGTVQNYANSDQRQDVVIVLLDFLNTSFNASNRIRHYLREMSQQLAESRTPVSILILNKDGLVQVHSFTTDPQEFAKVVLAWSERNTFFSESSFVSSYATTQPATWSNPFDLTQDASITDATLQHYAVPPGYIDADRLARDNLRAEITAKAFEQIGEMFRGIGGRKRLLWVSTGFPLSFPSKFDSLRANSEFQMAMHLTRAWRSMSAANMTIYTADSEGVTLESSLSRTLGLLEITQKTGGTNCTAAISECLRKTLDDGRHYYLLGFYLHGDPRPGWNQLKVKVDRPRHQVRSREGFTGVDVSPPAKFTLAEKHASEQDQLMTALLSPGDYTGVPLRVSWKKTLAADKPGIELLLTSPPGGIELDPSHTFNVDYMAVVRPVGKAEGNWFPASLSTQLPPPQRRAFLAHGFLYRKQIPLAPGRYAVRVLVRDNLAQKIGTISTVVEIPAPATAP